MYIDLEIYRERKRHMGQWKRRLFGTWTDWHSATHTRRTGQTWLSFVYP